MDKKVSVLIIFSIAVVITIGVSFFLRNKAARPIACTMEAKLCPDGTAVGRIGPRCEFAACPGEKIGGGAAVIRGTVTVGPICPVERVDMPCKTPPEAYTSREVILYAADGITVVKQLNFDPDGTYRFEVSAGVYILDIPRPGVGGSKDLPQTVSIKPGETVEVNFSIDTGIR